MNESTKVNGDRIRQAREIRGLTQQELAKIIGADQSTVARYERDLLTASDTQLQAIALATGFPVSFFRRPPGPEFPFGSLMNRARGSLHREDRDRLRQLGRLTFELASILADGFVNIDVHVPSADASDPVKAAQITRNSFGLSPDTPLINIISRLERNGVFVFAIPDEIDEHDAYSLWADAEPRKPVIVVSGGKPGDRLRWNVAHELGHLVMHRALGASVVEREGEADRFASELLAPRAALLQELQPPLTLTRFAELKARWGVSIQALITSARNLELISDRQREYLYYQLSARGWRKAEPVAIPLERPRLLRKMAEVVFGVPIDYAKVAQTVGAPAKLVQEILEQHSTKEAIRGAQTPAVQAPLPEIGRMGDVLDFAVLRRTNRDRKEG